MICNALHALRLGLCLNVERGDMTVRQSFKMVEKEENIKCPFVDAK